MPGKSTTDENFYIRWVEEEAGASVEHKPHRRVVGREGLHPLQRTLKATAEEAPVVVDGDLDLRVQHAVKTTKGVGELNRPQKVHMAQRIWSHVLTPLSIDLRTLARPSLKQRLTFLMLQPRSSAISL